MPATLNDEVRAYWEKEPCGTNPGITGAVEPGSRAWFDRVERHRYQLEPFILTMVGFERFQGKKILEVGVGAGSDHLQWAKAGADCYGVDLTDAAIETTRRHLAHHGLTSNLRRIDAEGLPFEEYTFDAVYSWGVIHHSDKPEQIVRQIHRVLKPGGEFIGMFYGRQSLVALKLWVKHGLLKGRPWRSLADVVWHHMESVGTKSYTPAEMRRMFGAFSGVAVRPVLTHYDRTWLPRWLTALVPNRFGWFLVIRAKK